MFTIPLYSHSVFSPRAVEGGVLKSRTSGALPPLCERSRRMFPQLEGLGLKVGKIGIAVAMEILRLLVGNAPFFSAHTAIYQAFCILQNCTVAFMSPLILRLFHHNTRS